MKYVTTKKHPDYKKGKIIKGEKDDIILALKLSWGREAISNFRFENWLKKGWIKEVKEKVWVIDKDDNWKLVEIKPDKIAYTEDFPTLIKFKSKKKALNYVLKEAKDRFKKGTKIKQIGIGNECIIEELELWTNDYVKSAWINNIGGDDLIIWNKDDGWIAEPIKSYPKTDDDIIEFAPSVEHYLIGENGVNKSYNNHSYYFYNTVPTKELAKAFLSLMKLIKFRNAWWEVDGWEPSISDDFTTTEYIQPNMYRQKSILAFKDIETRNEFYNTFKEDIEIAKELI